MPAVFARDELEVVVVSVLGVAVGSLSRSRGGEVSAVSMNRRMAAEVTPHWAQPTGDLGLDDLAAELGDQLVTEVAGGRAPIFGRNGHLSLLVE